MRREFLANEMIHAVAHVCWDLSNAIFMGNTITCSALDEVDPHEWGHWREIMLSIRRRATVNCSCDSCAKLGLRKKEVRR